MQLQLSLWQVTNSTERVKLAKPYPDTGISRCCRLCPTESNATFRLNPPRAERHRNQSTRQPTCRTAMPLSFFDHKSLSHLREEIENSDKYGHTFGGDPSSFGIRFVNCDPIHLVYRLNQADPAVSLSVPKLNWLPLCYHFSYASFDGKLVYRMLNDLEVELLAPTEMVYDPDFPYPNFPRFFSKSFVSFRNQNYDPTVAEDALRLAAVFGLEHLSRSEMKRAIVMADETFGTIREFGLPGWTPEEIIRCAHREPFAQGAPSKSCDNPSCTAEIAYRTAELSLSIDDENFRELTGQSSLTLEPRNVRRDSMRVFAIHQADDRTAWPNVQLVFEICDSCHCIRVSNQCT